MDIASDTIIAHCTPPGPGAIALLRISGSKACDVANCMSRLSSGKQIMHVPTHTIHYGYVLDALGNDLDQVLFFVMRAPSTFTGEDVVEISCHNNTAIIESIITSALAFGARLAQAGEFTRRAVDHGKIDLIQAESINELIGSNTQQSLKISLKQLKGSLSQELATIEKSMIKALALSEASFEFIDEEDMQFNEQIAHILKEVLQRIVYLKKAYDMRQHIKEGVRVALIGSVNAGKSSLFNALLGKERAIVTSIAGTTRDVIEAGMYYNGMSMTMVDTAGLRSTEDIVERCGIERSYQEVQKADVVLLVIDESRLLCKQEIEVYDDLYTHYKSKIIVIGSKSDVLHDATHVQGPIRDMHVSAITGAGLADLEALIEKKIEALCRVSDMPFLINKRQLTLMISFEHFVHNCLDLASGDVQYEILSYTIQHALAQLSELTGKTISEAGMDAIFKEFCVGK